MAAASTAPVLDHPSVLIEHGWPYPAEKDGAPLALRASFDKQQVQGLIQAACGAGWTAAINALRLDAADLSAALTALVPRCKSTEPLPAWEALILSSYFERFDRSFRRHTEHGRDIFLPVIKTRTSLPEGLTLGAPRAFNNGLAPAMDACKKVVRALCGKNPVLDARDAMLELQGKFEATKVLLLARLAEEEKIGIPFMRTHFTHAEMRVAVRKVLAGSRPMDLPQMLRPMAPAERADWLSLHGVPHIVQVLLINPRCRHYEAKFTSPLAALTAGVPPAPRQRAAGALLQCLKPQAVDGKAHHA